MIKPPFPDQQVSNPQEFRKRLKEGGRNFDEPWKGYRPTFFTADGLLPTAWDAVWIENAKYPVWWVWKNQIPELVNRIAELEAKQEGGAA